MEQRPVCLSVGGSDSCAGAGIQADLRVFEALGVHGCSATTALTAQNPEHVLSIEPSSITHFTAELEAVMHYYDVRCIKTGMLYDTAHLQALIPWIDDIPLIVDPVLIASSGTYLFDKDAARPAYEALLTHATLWTPNLEEAAYFLGSEVNNSKQAAQALQNKYQKAVLLKGGHGTTNVLQDIYCDTSGNILGFEHQKQSLSNAQTHGTGCRLAAAIAAYLALNHDLSESVSLAIAWLQSDLNTRS